MSTSVIGLQRCLDFLHVYCYGWGLHVNTLKTKAMVLTKQRYKTERFMYNGTLIEYVKSFNYLEFEISHNGKFSNLIKDRVLKAEKTSNMVLQAIRTDKNASVKLSLSLFERQIYPILSYGCSVWSLPDTHNLIYLDAQNENQNARNIVSNILFNLLGRNVPIKYARKIGRKNTCIIDQLSIDYVFTMTSWKSCALPKSLVAAFENFKRKIPVIWRRCTPITWKGLSISISTPAVYVSMKSLIDSRLLIELGPWQLNTDCESPLEHRTGYWMRHI